MSGYSIVLALLAISLYGLLQITRDLRKCRSKHDFAVEFLGQLKSCWESRGGDSETYGWLIHRSNKMQAEMGAHGVLHGYKPPYQNYIIKNYDVILNMLPDLRRCLEDNIISDHLAYQFLSMLQESLIRYLGSLEDAQEEITRDVQNPIKWFRDGVRDIVALPAYLLSWLGVIPEIYARKFVSSFVFSAISGMVAFLGFSSAVITIAIGWHEFIDVVRNIMP
jgi:hypothetical protein